MRRLTSVAILLASVFVACSLRSQTPQTPLDEEFEPGNETVDNVISKENRVSDWSIDEYGIPSIELEEFEYDDVHIRKCLFYSYTGLLTMDYFIEYPQVVEFYDDDIRNKINQRLYEMVIGEDLSTWYPGISFQNISYEITLLNKNWLSIFFYGYGGEGHSSISFDKAVTFNLKSGETVSLQDIYPQEYIAELSNLLVNDTCRIMNKYEGPSYENSYSLLLEHIPDHAETLLNAVGNPNTTSFYLRDGKLIIFCSASGRVWYFVEFEIDDIDL